MKRETIAYHEAGHAVAAVVLRRGTKRASIVSHGDSAGHVLHHVAARHPDEYLDNASEWRVRRNVLISLAGPAAHAKYTKKSTSAVLGTYRCSQDRRDVQDYLIAIGEFTPGK